MHGLERLSNSTAELLSAQVNLVRGHAFNALVLMLPFDPLTHTHALFLYVNVAEITHSALLSECWAGTAHQRCPSE